MLKTILARIGVRNLYRPALYNVMAQRVPIVPVMKLHDLHTKGDQELVTFLKDEIVAESKNLKTTIPTKVGEFQVSLNQAEVKFERSLKDEKISVRFNVNHTVDSEASEEAPQKDEEGEMRSKPNFDIEIKKGNQTLFFSCSFLHEQPPTENQEEYNDLFLIEEISLYEGEFKEHTYAVAGNILDGYLYDLFMNMLEDRGVTSEFVEKLSDFATDYEHQLYVGLLKNLQDFVQKK